MRAAACCSASTGRGAAEGTRGRRPEAALRPSRSRDLARSIERAARRPDRRTPTPARRPAAGARRARRGFVADDGLPRSSTTRSASCSRSATASPTPRAGRASTTRATTCWPPRRASPASSRSRRARCRRTTGSTSAGRSPAWTARRCCSRGAHRVRVPDAAPADAALPGHAARPLLRARRCAPGAVRGEPRRALGHLGVGASRSWTARPLPVQGLRRAGPGLEARARRTSWWSPLRDGARRARRSPSRGAQPAAARRARARGPLGYYEAIDYTPRKRESPPVAARRGCAGSCVRAYLAHHQGMTLVRARATCCATPPWCGASTPTPRAGHRAAAAGARAEPRRRSRSRGRAEETRVAPPPGR